MPNQWPALAVVLFVVGVACWRARVIRSLRWALSALGIVVVAAAILVVVYIAVMIAGSSV